MRSMYRYRVGIDGPERVVMTGEPVAFAPLPYSAGIEFWAEHDDAKPEVPRTFVIFGTGHPVPARAVHVGTAPRTGEGLVWHLFELPGGES